MEGTQGCKRQLAEGWVGVGTGRRPSWIPAALCPGAGGDGVTATDDTQSELEMTQQQRVLV